MAYTKEAVNDLLSKVLKDIDISDEMFTKAKTEYESLGEWINEASDEYSVSIYPQGSFALGTVIKPISGKDDYDLDLVCELAEQYDLTARQLKKEVVKPWLEDYKTRSTDLIEKRRCWHVNYDSIPNFHMDVIPAFDPSLSSIKITEHNEDQDTYCYVGSNPKGYIDWFYSRCQVRWEALFEQYSKDQHLRADEAEIQRLDRHKVKTPLQKAIQLLKRHRDIMFKNNPDDKPISIIITTLAAHLYNNEDNTADAIMTFLSGAEQYIEDHKQNGRYYIENPSFAGENFADKWNCDPKRAEHFFEWLAQAKADLSLSVLQQIDRIEMGKRIKRSFGDETGRRVFSYIGAVTTAGVVNRTTKVETATGRLSPTGNITVAPNHHYHGKVSEN